MTLLYLCDKFSPVKSNVSPSFHCPLLGSRVSQASPARALPGLVSPLFWGSCRPSQWTPLPPLPPLCDPRGARLLVTQPRTEQRMVFPATNQEPPATLPAGCAVFQFYVVRLTGSIDSLFSYFGELFRKS